MTAPDRAQRSGVAPVLIVVPSLISGIGVAFLLVAILANNRIVQDTSLVLGALLLWADFFVTMAIFRYTVRNIDRRLRRIESRLAHDAASGHRGAGITNQDTEE